MNKKILFLGHFPPPFHGVAVFNKNLLESELSKRFDLDFLAINTATSMSNIGMFSFNKINLLQQKFLELKRKLNNNKYDFCYFSLTPHGIGFLKDIFFVSLLKRFNLKTIYHLHGKGISKKKDPLSRFLYQWCFKKNSAIVLGKSLVSDVNDYLAREDIKIVYNALKPSVKEEAYNQAVNLRKIRPMIKLAFLSNMVRSKGVFTLLEACSMLKEKGYSFKLSFAGNWFDIKPKDFWARVEELKMSSYVEYLGFQSGQNKCKLLSDSDIFVYPTYNDTFPLVILEAMEWGLPIITTAQGAIPEVVENGKTGFIIPERTPSVLAERIEFLIHHLDVRLKFGQAGRQRFQERYTYDKLLTTLINIFLQAIS